MQREGYCRNKLGAGKWGVCNKRMREDAYFEFWGARYDRETNTFIGPWSPARRPGPDPDVERRPR